MPLITCLFGTINKSRHLFLGVLIWAFAVCPAAASDLENPTFLQPVYELLLSERRQYLSINQPSVPIATSNRINFGNLPGNNGDRVGILRPEAESNWGNVLRWSYTNGTTSMDQPGPAAGSLVFEALEESRYEARLFFDNTYEGFRPGSHSR